MQSNEWALNKLVPKFQIVMVIGSLHIIAMSPTPSPLEICNYRSDGTAIFLCRLLKNQEERILYKMRLNEGCYNGTFDMLLQDAQFML